MNISLTDILSRVTQGQSNQTGGAASASAIAKQLHTSALLNSLVTGQTISGQIRSMQGSQILLSMGNGVEINARLDGDIKASVGQNMLFEVKGSSDDKLTLSPLYTNLSAGKNAAAGALHAAGMPVTDENVAMVKSMMEEGMSIDKTSLWQMGKMAADFPQASAETIVKLTAMGLEVNTTNVMQYEAAKNMKHQLLYTMEELTNALPQTLSSFIEENRASAGVQFMKEMMEILQNGQNVQDASGETADQGNQVKALIQELDALLQEIAGGKGENSEAGKISAQSAALQEGKANAGSAVLQEEIGKTDLQNVAQDKTGMVGAQSAVLQEEAGKVQVGKQESAALLQGDGKLAEQGMEKLPDALKERFLELQKELTEQVKNLLLEEWAIKPENFANKEEVKALYQKIKNQAGQMQELFAAAGKTETQAGQTLQNMNQNLQFMENVNQFFPYLQIPLKASLENAHGELYVYQKKKGKVSEDGSCSALLHLEMEHLGNLDVYVKMKDYNVSTQFTLANEETLDFLAAHIDLLNERLNKKGYHMNAEMKYKQEEKEDVIGRIRGEKVQGAVISYTAFDVRA